MAVFFTADTHFGHDAIRRNCDRPFSSVQEMDRALIDNWNSRVRRDDVVYHLGDFAFKACEGLEHYRHKLHGAIHFIRGNHDPRIEGLLENLFDSVNDLSSIKVEGQSIVLCHYAMTVWERSHKGSWQLFGHSHGELPDDPLRLSLDVGVDCHNYRPIAFDEIREIMETKQALMNERSEPQR